MHQRQIKVLIVDDSMVFRETLARGISSDPGIVVVGTAPDPYAARDLIIEHEPDVMTLDVEMPRMNGIEFLKRLMPQHPIPVVVISAANQWVFDALNAGAVDFVNKPEVSAGKGLESMINELIVKIKIASTAKVGHWKAEAPKIGYTGAAYGDPTGKVIAIGASTGGTEAIYNILRYLPREMPGIVIVQHMPPVFTRMYAERLNNNCRLEVREAQDGDRLIPGRVLIAPGDYHMALKKTGPGYSVDCFAGNKVNGHCPSVDVLFESVVRHVGKNAIGVLLTGMGHDGAGGLMSMRRNGARTLGQDEGTCIVYGMPKVAFEIGAVERQIPLQEMAGAILSLAGSGRE